MINQFGVNSSKSALMNLTLQLWCQAENRWQQQVRLPRLTSRWRRHTGCLKTTAEYTEVKQSLSEAVQPSAAPVSWSQSTTFCLRTDLHAFTSASSSRGVIHFISRPKWRRFTPWLITLSFNLSFVTRRQHLRSSDGTIKRRATEAQWGAGGRFH